jgi:hypothetical protein
MQFQIDLATPTDDPAIRRLCRREPMPGNITVTYEREPDFLFGCRVTGTDFQVLVAREQRDGEVVGVACRSTRELFINGVTQRIGYLGQLRIDQRFRGRWLVSRGFSLLKQLHERDPLPAYLVSIVKGNQVAEEILVRKPRKSFPSFHPVADFSTLAISLGHAKPTLSGALDILSASAEGVGELVRFLQSQGARRQFFPVWSENSLRKLTSLGLRIEDLRVARRNGEIIGVAGLWDQSAYKQTVVQGYSGWLKAAAPLYNLTAPWIGHAALPRPGAKVGSVYAAFVCIANDEAQVFSALLRELYNLAHSRGFDYLMLGLDVRDPLLPIAKKYAHVLYASRLYLAEWPDGGHFHEHLDHRAAYLDIATL